MEELGVNKQTEITVLTDGDAGLRTVQWEVGARVAAYPRLVHIWMRFEHLLDASKADSEGVHSYRDTAAAFAG